METGELAVLWRPLILAKTPQQFQKNFRTFVISSLFPKLYSIGLDDPFALCAALCYGHLRRIERRATPEVLEAYRAGRITARRADILFYLPADQQAAELECRLSEAHERETRHRLVAEAIRKYLDGLGGRQVDLSFYRGFLIAVPAFLLAVEFLSGRYVLLRKTPGSISRTVSSGAVRI
jgi:hypothetical protein